MVLTEVGRMNSSRTACRGAPSDYSQTLRGSLVESSPLVIVEKIEIVPYPQHRSHADFGERLEGIVP